MMLTVAAMRSVSRLNTARAVLPMSSTAMPESLLSPIGSTNWSTPSSARCGANVPIRFSQ